jgi:5-(carboxyamino)imidazole ribonucleotide mutase
MPPGVPVATVGIDNAKNAAILAAQIIALSNPDVAKALADFREEQSTKGMEHRAWSPGESDRSGFGFQA